MLHHVLSFGFFSVLGVLLGASYGASLVSLHVYRLQTLLLSPSGVFCHAQAPAYLLLVSHVIACWLTRDADCASLVSLHVQVKVAWSLYLQPFMRLLLYAHCFQMSIRVCHAQASLGHRHIHNGLIYIRLRAG